MNYKDVLKKFGKNVKLERIKKDYSQEDLAAILDVNRNYISKIECGNQNMSLKKITELANALNTNIENLLKFNE
jgi:transcriptional regulator with XRE-family HTH domain